MYSGIKSSRNGYASITYPMTDKKYQTEERIGAFRCGGGIVDTGSVKGIRKQFARVWKRGGRAIGDIQAYMLLFSFSSNELNPANPASLEQAADLASAAIQRIYSGHQYTLISQRDGHSGLVHVHATVNALNSKTLKACRGRQTSYRTIRDEIEAEMEQAGIAVDYGKNHAKAAMKQQKRTRAVKADPKAYCWTEDLTERIRTALNVTISFSDLENNLKKLGVKVTRKTKSSWTFVLEEAKEEKYSGKKSRGDRLNAAFVPGQMRKIIDDNYKNAVAKLLFEEDEDMKDEKKKKDNIGKLTKEALEKRHDKRVAMAENLEVELFGRVHSVDTLQLRKKDV